jgi:hypothetical protein
MIQSKLAVTSYLLFDQPYHSLWETFKWHVRENAHEEAKSSRKSWKQNSSVTSELYYKGKGKGGWPSPISEKWCGNDHTRKKTRSGEEASSLLSSGPGEDGHGAYSDKCPLLCPLSPSSSISCSHGELRTGRPHRTEPSHSSSCCPAQLCGLQLGTQHQTQVSPACRTPAN